MFKQVAPITNFPALESEILELWRARGILEKCIAHGASQGRRFVFYEGPPTANGLPHNGHVLTRVVKDLFLRYRTMRGDHVPRKAGWDTHGLPVEVEVEKELRITGKAAIEQYGVEPFIRRCIESVFRYTAEWEHLTRRIGFWVDLEDAYATFHESYVESVWWALSELFAKGLLYRGHKVVWWWAKGGTALSAAEVGQGYRSVDDPSIYVRFPIVGQPGTSLVAWTTTPWTLPSNAFAAVKRDVPYVVVRHGDERLVVAEALREALAGKLGAELPVERTIPGAELVGLRYTPPFDWYTARFGEATAPRKEGPAAHVLWRVLDAPFVDLATGTGIVHVAPAFGEVDFDLLRVERERFVNADDVPLLCAVRPDGQFGDDAPERHRGRFVKELDKDLVRELKERGSVLHAEQIRHEYPFCVRADEDPLIQYARPAWYIRTTAEIGRAIEQNRRVNWLPEHIKEGRFGDFLANNVDWALSRERYWGTPLNIWINDVTGALDAPASVAEILARNPAAFARFDADRAADPSLSPDLRVHKPWIDHVTWEKPGEPGTYRRVPEVIDCWFDSGCMPFAQWGFPHQGRERFRSAFPADFITEAIDQTRGWFYSLLMVSTLVFDDECQRRYGLEPASTSPHPYRTCLVLGHVCDREGKKESKSKGNYTPPETILDRVRMDFAVLADDALPAGVAEICPEDFAGLDLSEGARLAASRPAAGAPSTPLAVRAKKGLPRRIVALGAEARGALGVEVGPRGAAVMPVEVPRLPPEHRVTLEDTSTPAPGADAFRWFFFASNPPWSNTRHSLGSVRALQKELPLKLRNCFAFFTIYAGIDRFDPRDRAGHRATRERSMLDRWILSELALATRRTTELLDGYRVYEATQVLTELVDGLSNWWVRRSRERFWRSGVDQDKRDAYFTLYECLTTLARLCAPFLPFAAEEIWQDLVLSLRPDEAPSVHLAGWPEADVSAIDAALSAEMEAVRGVVSLGLSVRTAQKIKVRQPLEVADVIASRPELAEVLARHRALVEEELNVHRLELATSGEGLVKYVVKPNFKALGKRLGKQMQAVKAALSAADGGKLRAALQATGHCEVVADGATVTLGPEEVEVAIEALAGFAAATGPVGVVLLSTTLTPALLEEGQYREVLSKLQGLRKERALEYTARIRLSLEGPADLLAAIAPRKETLARQILATEIRLGEPPAPGASVHELEVDGKPLRVGLEMSAG